MGCRAYEISRKWDVAQIKYHATGKWRKKNVEQMDVAQIGCRADGVSRKKKWRKWA